MATEFVVGVNVNTFPESQELPDIYKEDCFRENRDLYLTSSRRYRFKVRIVKKNNGQIWLVGDKWSEFATENFDLDVKVLHFVEEGEDSFYVTGYYEDGTEVGGYNGIVGRYMRCMTRVLPYPNIAQTISADFMAGLPEHAVMFVFVNGANYLINVNRVQVEGSNVEFVYRLWEDDWNTIVQDLELEAGRMVVFTKETVNVFRLIAFDNDGSPTTTVDFLGATSLLRNQRTLDFWEDKDKRLQHICYWPLHREHFGEQFDTFYVRFEMIEPKQRLTFPANFLKYHPMHTYTKVMMKHQDIQQVMTIRMEKHTETPNRTNNVKVYGDWDYFAERCGFEYKKMIRFRYMFNVEDVLSDSDIESDSDVESQGNEAYPVFHVC